MDKPYLLKESIHFTVLSLVFWCLECNFALFDCAFFALLWFTFVARYFVSLKISFGIETLSTKWAFLWFCGFFSSANLTCFVFPQIRPLDKILATIVTYTWGKLCCWQYFIGYWKEKEFNASCWFIKLFNKISTRINKKLKMMVYKIEFYAYLSKI